MENVTVCANRQEPEPGRIENEKGLQLVLVSNSGSLQELSILHGSESVYALMDHTGTERLLRIANGTKQWTAFCTGTARFVTEHGPEGAMLLFHNAMLRIDTENGGYRLYVEGMNENSVVRHNYTVDKNCRISIGRLDECDITVHNSLASRNHASDVPT